MPLKHRLVAGFAGALLFFAFVSVAAARLSPYELALLAQINRARVANGLRRLRADPHLERAARAHSLDMLRHGYFDHRSFARRMTAVHARGRIFAENLAWGSGSYSAPAAIVTMWLASPEHRANLLQPRFSRIGLGAVRGTFYGASGAVVITIDLGGG